VISQSKHAMLLSLLNGADQWLCLTVLPFTPTLPLLYTKKVKKGKEEEGKEKRKRKSYKVRKLSLTRNKKLKSMDYVLANKKPLDIKGSDFIKEMHYYL
jgi:hypothetical protein